MAFRRLAPWSKAVVILGASAIGGFAGLHFYRELKEVYKNFFNVGYATRDTQRRCEEGFKTMQQSAECRSLLKKYLTEDLLNQLKDRQTISGGNLLHVIQSGVKNLDSIIGVYAPDPQSYKLFAKLFDPIIRDFHSLGAESKQPASDFGEGRLDYFQDLDPQKKYIQSTRIRCIRNIKDFPFNPLLRADDYLYIEQAAKEAFAAIDDDRLKGSYEPLDELNEDVKRELTNNHLLFSSMDRFVAAAKGYQYWPLGRGVFYNSPLTFIVWVNGEDSFRFISMQKDGNIKEAFQRLADGVKQIEKHVPFAPHDPTYGCLTFDPRNLGSTVRASVFVKLPKLSKRSGFKQMCDELNIEVYKIDDSTFYVSNRQLLGLSEYETVKQLYDGLKVLLDVERSKG